MSEEKKSVLQTMNDSKPGDSVFDKGEPNSVKGLHLRHYKSGNKTFHLRYCFDNRLYCLKIGDNLRLSEARKIAMDWYIMARNGKNPKFEFDNSKNGQTISDLFWEVYHKHWAKPRFVESGRANEVRNIFLSKIDKPIGKENIINFKTVDIESWHESISAKPFMANRALEVLKFIYTYATEHEKIPRNYAKSVKACPERKRKRMPSREELTKILKALFDLAKEPGRYQYAAIFVIGLFYTGARPQMIVDVKWSDKTFEDEKGIGFQLRGKMSYKFNENEKLFVPRVVLDLMKGLELPPDNKVFWGKRSREVWLMLTTKYECPNLWLRDTRKAFAGLGLKKGLTYEQIGAALNHRSAQTTKNYALDFDNTAAETVSIVADELNKLLE